MSLSQERGRTALITGANKGLGYETARQLGARSYTVWIGARNKGKGEAAAAQLLQEGIDAHFVELDVTRPPTIESAARKVERLCGKLDVLVNNAGVFLDNAPPSELDIELLRQTFETNVFGAFAVTRTMLPLLAKSPAGRVVNVSSSLGSLSKLGDPDFEFADFLAAAYNSSKTALNALTVQFAKQWKDSPIKFNAADPGYMATDMTANQGRRTVQQGAVIVVCLATLPDDGPSGAFYDANGAIPW